jgi:hypothetical protein
LRAIVAEDEDFDIVARLEQTGQLPRIVSLIG